MRDLRKYWQEIRKLERELPPFVWLTQTKASGPLVEVPAEKAAKMLHDKSHRLAEESEIDAHKAQEELAKQKAFQEDMRRRGIAMVTVTPGSKKR